jgi:hypothetical protein
VLALPGPAGTYHGDDEKFERETTLLLPHGEVELGGKCKPSEGDSAFCMLMLTTCLRTVSPNHNTAHVMGRPANDKRGADYPRTAALVVQ